MQTWSSHNQENTTLIQWFLGNSCNFDCSYCANWAKSGDKKWPTIGLALQFVAKTIQHYRNLKKTVLFDFVGGEPTQWLDLGTLLEQINLMGAKSGIHTNGSAPIEWWENNKHNIHTMVLSIHPEFANLDHINQVISSMPESCSITVNIVHHSDQKLWEFAEFAYQNIKAKHGNQIKPTRQALFKDHGRNSKLYPYSHEQTQILFPDPGTNEDIHRDKNFQNQTEQSIQTHDYNNIIKQDLRCFLNWKCFIGIEQLVIDANGSIFRGWCRQGGSLGNISENYGLPTEPITCQAQSCQNHFDLQAKKSYS